MAKGLTQCPIAPMVRPVMQVRIDKDLAKPIRLAAINKSQSVPKYVSHVLRSHINRSKSKKK